MTRIVTQFLLLMAALLLVFARASFARSEAGSTSVTISYSRGPSSRTRSSLVLQATGVRAGGTLLAANSASTDASSSTDVGTKADSKSQNSNPQFKFCEGTRSGHDCLAKKCEPGDHEQGKGCRRHKSGDDD